MYTLTQKFGKSVISVALAVTLLFAVSTFIHPQRAEAAYSLSKAKAIIADGKSYLGTPYRFGASTSTTRYFDCSSFTKRVYGMNGIYLPRVSKDQSKRGYYVARKNLKKGDLVFFDTSSSRPGIDHVAIYAGDGKLLHTFRVGVGVTISKLSWDYWNRRYVTARRVIN